jgi:hypothetical protein
MSFIVDIKTACICIHVHVLVLIMNFLKKIHNFKISKRRKELSSFNMGGSVQT